MQSAGLVVTDCTITLHYTKKLFKNNPYISTCRFPNHPQALFNAPRRRDFIAHSQYLISHLQPLRIKVIIFHEIYHFPFLPAFGTPIGAIIIR